jgi:hypothetical protein
MRRRRLRGGQCRGNVEFRVIANAKAAATSPGEHAEIHSLGERNGDRLNPTGIRRDTCEGFGCKSCRSRCGRSEEQRTDGLVALSKHNAWPRFLMGGGVDGAPDQGRDNGEGQQADCGAAEVFHFTSFPRRGFIRALKTLPSERALTSYTHFYSGAPVPLTAKQALSMPRSKITTSIVEVPTEPIPDLYVFSGALFLFRLLESDAGRFSRARYSKRRIIRQELTPRIRLDDAVIKHVRPLELRPHKSG